MLHTLRAEIDVAIGHGLRYPMNVFAETCGLAISLITPPPSGGYSRSSNEEPKEVSQQLVLDCVGRGSIDRYHRGIGGLYGGRSFRVEIFNPHQVQ